VVAGEHHDEHEDRRAEHQRAVGHRLAHAPPRPPPGERQGGGDAGHDEQEADRARLEQDRQVGVVGGAQRLGGGQAARLARGAQPLPERLGDRLGHELRRRGDAGVGRRVLLELAERPEALDDRRRRRVHRAQRERHEDAGGHERGDAGQPAPAREREEREHRGDEGDPRGAQVGQRERQGHDRHGQDGAHAEAPARQVPEQPEGEDRAEDAGRVQRGEDADLAGLGGVEGQDVDRVEPRLVPGRQRQDVLGDAVEAERRARDEQGARPRRGRGARALVEADDERRGGREVGAERVERRRRRARPRGQADEQPAGDEQQDAADLGRLGAARPLEGRDERGDGDRGHGERVGREVAVLAEDAAHAGHDEPDDPHGDDRGAAVRGVQPEDEAHDGEQERELRGDRRRVGERAGGAGGREDREHVAPPLRERPHAGLA